MSAIRENQLLTSDAARIITDRKGATSPQELVTNIASKIGTDNSFFIVDPESCEVAGLMHLPIGSFNVQFSPYSRILPGIQTSKATRRDYRVLLEEALENLKASDAPENICNQLQQIRIRTAAELLNLKLSEESFTFTVQRENVTCPIGIKPVVAKPESSQFEVQDSKDLLQAIASGMMSSKMAPLRWTRTTPPPSIGAVEHLNTLLLACLFPGYFSNQIQEGMTGIRRLLDKMYRLLTKQTCLSLRCDLQEDVPESEAKDYVKGFLMHFPAIRQKLDADVSQAMVGDPAASSREEVILTYPGIRAVAVYRCANILSSLQIPLLPRMMCEQIHSTYGIDIHPDATIGRGFFIDHGTGVTIGQTTIIGCNVRIYQGVTLGALSFDTDEMGFLRQRGATYKRHPTIGDNVVIYANASILGGRTHVGSNSVIGANVRLTKSVHPESIVTTPKQLPRIRMNNEQEDGSGI